MEKTGQSATTNDAPHKKVFLNGKTAKGTRRRKVLLYTAAAITALIVLVGAWAWVTVARTYDGAQPVRIYIPRGADSEAVSKILTDSLGSYGATVARIWRWRDGNPEVAAGSYVITEGDRAWSVVNRLRFGAQTPIRLTFNNIRTLGDLASRISAKMIWDSLAFVNGCAEVLPVMGYDTPEQYIAAFVPDTYEAFWTDSPAKLIKRLTTVRDAFWTSERCRQAKALNLTPTQVTTLASIVEEETAKDDERPKVARLYLNRLAIDMPLQADPTVKFAMGDPTLRRITGPMLRTPSPYNTYLKKAFRRVLYVCRNVPPSMQSCMHRNTTTYICAHARTSADTTISPPITPYTRPTALDTAPPLMLAASSDFPLSGYTPSHNTPIAAANDGPKNYVASNAKAIDLSGRMTWPCLHARFTTIISNTL